MNRRHRRAAILFLPALVLSLSCVTVHRQARSNALEFLYPEGREAVPAQSVELRLPLRVGVAFAPATNSRTMASATFSENQKQALLERVSEAFRARPGIASVEPIPSGFLSEGGGFENVDRIARALGIDLIALLSYDQRQVSDTGNSSWTYWTLVGAYVVKGEKNETHTVVNAVVYDIPSRALLFNASGESAVGGRSTPIKVDRQLRKRSEEGLDRATRGLIADLDTELDGFMRQAVRGTVRGVGTPAIQMIDEQGRPVTSGSIGLGSSGPAEAALILLMLAALWYAGRRRPALHGVDRRSVDAGTARNG